MDISSAKGGRTVGDHDDQPRLAKPAKNLLYSALKNGAFDAGASTDVGCRLHEGHVGWRWRHAHRLEEAPRAHVKACIGVVYSLPLYVAVLPFVSSRARVAAAVFVPARVFAVLSPWLCVCVFARLYVALIFCRRLRLPLATAASKQASQKYEDAYNVYGGRGRGLMRMRALAQERVQCVERKGWENELRCFYIDLPDLSHTFLPTLFSGGDAGRAEIQEIR